MRNQSAEQENKRDFQQAGNRRVPKDQNGNNGWDGSVNTNPLGKKSATFYHQKQPNHTNERFATKDLDLDDLAGRQSTSDSTNRDFLGHRIVKIEKLLQSIVQDRNNNNGQRPRRW